MYCHATKVLINLSDSNGKKTRKSKNYKNLPTAL